jgi:uncharacterized protein YndB with AHSA1/START domain
MKQDFVANCAISIEASPARVWRALVTPRDIKRYMFGTNVETSWKVGSPITWQGEWEGKPYQDKGVIKAFQPERRLQFTHFSPLAGLPDVPDSYHAVTIELEPLNGGTRVTLAQDNNPSDEARKHSEKNWDTMLASLKGFLEEPARTTP